MKTRNQAVSIRKRLSNLAQKYEVNYSHVATSFLIERLVARITSDKSLYDSLVFKGGYVALRIYHSSRFTIDLDASLIKSKLEDVLNKVKTASNKDLGDSVWFKFEKEEKLKHQNDGGGVRQIYRSGIGEIPKKINRQQIIHFDLGVDDHIIPGPIQTKTSELIGENELSWYVYPIETIIAEKIHALVGLGQYNSRSKDIFDLSSFIPTAQKEDLKIAIDACFNKRGTKKPDNLIEYLKSIDLNLIRQGWKSATMGIKDAPKFEESYQKIIESLTLKGIQ